MNYCKFEKHDDMLHIITKENGDSGEEQIIHLNISKIQELADALANLDKFAQDSINRAISSKIDLDMQEASTYVDGICISTQTICDDDPEVEEKYSTVFIISKEYEDDVHLLVIEQEDLNSFIKDLIQQSA